jgi:hypothetical protein
MVGTPHVVRTAKLHTEEDIMFGRTIPEVLAALLESMCTVASVPNSIIIIHKRSIYCSSYYPVFHLTISKVALEICSGCSQFLP